MEKQNIVFVIVAEKVFIRTTKSDVDISAQNDILFSAIADTYVPVLNMLSTLERDKCACKLGVVMSAPLCTLLDDPQIQKEYVSWIDHRIALGEAETIRTKKDPELNKNAVECLEKAEKDEADFCEVYGENLLEQFRNFASKDMVELIPTAATYAFLPDYSDLKEVLNAQVETGLYAHRHFFGDSGDGFWLPYMGWCKDIEKVLRSYGVNYTFIATQSLLFADNVPAAGIFAPARCNNSLALFTKDNDTPEDISGEKGYARNSMYRAQQKDVGFDIGLDALAPFIGKKKTRVQTGYKYYANGESEDDSVVYDSGKALEQTKKDAADFYEKKCAKLAEASSLYGQKDVLDVCVLPAELLGGSWFEGVSWLEQVIRIASEQKKVELALTKDLWDEQFTLPKVEPYPSAASGTGYGEDMLDSSNGWMVRYVRKASERMIDLTERFPSDTGLKARLLNLGARELLLAQPGDWAKLIHEEHLPDYASDYFRSAIRSSTMVLDSPATNTVSTEWLTEIEKEHSIFPWINYRIFSRKK